MPTVQLGPLSWTPTTGYGGKGYNGKGQVPYRSDLPPNPQLWDEWYVIHEDNVGYSFVWDGTAWMPVIGQRIWDGGWKGGATAITYIPEYALLTDLVLGVARDELFPVGRWLRCGWRPLVGQALQLGEQKFLGSITAPSSDGGSAQLSVPDGSVVSALQIDPLETLNIWYREYTGPADFKLGPEQQHIDTKEARSGGEGRDAYEDGWTITGFQLQKDPDLTLAIKTWHRVVL